MAASPSRAWNADLMAFGGRYAELYKLQASQYDTVQ